MLRNPVNRVNSSLTKSKERVGHYLTYAFCEKRIDTLEAVGEKGLRRIDPKTDVPNGSFSTAREMVGNQARWADPIVNLARRVRGHANRA